MPRDIPVGNGQMLVAFDQHYQLRDLYYPHVGQENHTEGGPCRFGVWASLPDNTADKLDRRKQRLFWSNEGWHIDLRYRPDTLATDVVMTHPLLQLELRCCDVVDFHRPVLVRKIEVVDTSGADRTVHLFHHNDFRMYGSKVGDTAYFDPQLRSMVHYRTKRYLMTTWHADGDQRIDEYASGTAGFRGAEGTWRDAEDGVLGNNAIAQGAVDSTIKVNLHVPANGSRTAYLIIGCGKSYDDLDEIHQFLHRNEPQTIIDRTIAYWQLWLEASDGHVADDRESGSDKSLADLFKRSLLIMRTQIDNSGAIIAANDSDIMQFSRDTYSYLWPRDGALVAASLDAAGFPDVARQFYGLCSRIITEHGYFLHKYNPDGSPASSWHPWVSMGRPQLPIQEDETALVIWALWRHYEKYRDIEFVRPLWMNLITNAADFLVRFRDPETKLPLPSYDLWEERWGVHAFTVASVYGGLEAARRFATCFGDKRRSKIYAQAAAEMKQAFCKYMWSKEHDRFLRRIVPLDHDRTAQMMAEVLAGRAPSAEVDHLSGDFSDNGGALRDIDPQSTTGPYAFELDKVIDSSMYAIFAFGLLDVDDKRVEKTMTAIEQRLWVKTPVGGLARYEDDYYHSVTDDVAAVPGNPWFICTLWLAEYHITKAKSVADLRMALPIFKWVANHALPSGVLAEQVHPLHNTPLSVSPLTWSHATVVSTMMAYQNKLAEMSACPACGQPKQCMLPHNHQSKSA